MLRHRPSSWAVVGGYLLACLCGSTVLAALIAFQSSLGHEHRLPPNALILPIFFLPFVIVLSLPGFSIAAIAARHWPLGSLWYYCVTGAVNGPFAYWLTVWKPLPLMSSFSATFMVSGAIAGSVYWLVTRPKT